MTSKDKSHADLLVEANIKYDKPMTQEQIRDEFVDLYINQQHLILALEDLIQINLGLMAQIPRGE